MNPDSVQLAMLSYEKDASESEPKTMFVAIYILV